jgi:phosphomethylpyrimidine synthase
MHDETLADDYFKTAESCSMCGPKFCPVHNFKDIDWDEIRTVVEERKRHQPGPLTLRSMSVAPSATRRRIR